jgi:hypothetical protein
VRPSGQASWRFCVWASDFCGFRSQRTRARRCRTRRGIRIAPPSAPAVRAVSRRVAVHYAQRQQQDDVREWRALRVAAEFLEQLRRSEASAGGYDLPPSSGTTVSSCGSPAPLFNRAISRPS